MRKTGVFAAVLVLSLLAAQAQLTVELVTDQDQFLTGESVLISARITNRSGKTLRFGSDNTWLSFTVEEREGNVVPILQEVPVTGEFDLESSKRATKQVDLSPCFALENVGRYLIKAIVRVKEWDREFQSLPKGIDIIDGTRLWERDFGVPNTSGTNTAPEIRKYRLQQANYLKGRLRLYLRITDDSGLRTIKLVPVGNLVSFSRPDPQVAADGKLHIMYQYGPKAFGYNVFAPDGTLVTRHTYDYTESRPRLKMDDQGTITVIGGARHELPSDIPPPKDEDAQPVVKKAEEPAPNQP